MNGDSNADDFNLPQSVQTLIKHDQNWGSIYRDEAEEPLKDIISSYGRLMGSEAEAVAKRWTEEVLQALETPSNPGFNFSDYLNKTKIVDTFGALNSDVKHFLYARSKHETITEDARLILPIDKNNGVLRINENYKPKVFVSKLGLKTPTERRAQHISDSFKAISGDLETVIKHSDFEKKWQDPLRQVLNKVDLGIDDEWYRIDAVLRFLSNELQRAKISYRDHPPAATEPEKKQWLKLYSAQKVVEMMDLGFAIAGTGGSNGETNSRDSQTEPSLAHSRLSSRHLETVYSDVQSKGLSRTGGHFI